MEADAEPSFSPDQPRSIQLGTVKESTGAKLIPHGSAIIGPTGSGKTTLVDALMTLLARYPNTTWHRQADMRATAISFVIFGAFPEQKTPGRKRSRCPARQNHDRHCRHLRWRWSAGHPWYDSMGGWQQQRRGRSQENLVLRKRHRAITRRPPPLTPRGRQAGDHSICQGNCRSAHLHEQKRI